MDVAHRLDVFLDLAQIARFPSPVPQIFKHSGLDLFGGNPLVLAIELRAHASMPIISVNRLPTVGRLPHHGMPTVAATQNARQDIKAILRTLKPDTFQLRRLLEQPLRFVKLGLGNDRGPRRLDQLIPLMGFQLLLIRILVGLVDLVKTHVRGGVEKIPQRLSTPFFVDLERAIFAAQFRLDPFSFQFLNRFRPRTRVHKKSEDFSDRLGFLFIDDIRTRLVRVLIKAKNRTGTVQQATHSSSIDPKRNPFRSLLALELRECNNQIDHQTTDRRARVELLFNRKEIGLVLFQKVQQLTEVQKIPRQARKIRHEDKVDFLPLQVGNHALIRGTFRIFGRITIVNVKLDNRAPALFLRVFQINIALSAVALVIK